MPGDCPASLRPTAVRLCGKHSAPSRTPFRWTTRTVRLPTGIGVRLQTGMLFGFITECCSASDRNRVRLRPDSPERSTSRLSYRLKSSMKRFLQLKDWSQLLREHQRTAFDPGERFPPLPEDEWLRPRGPDGRR